jgi:hypothetical protein
MLQHPAHNTLTGADIACQSNCIFARPLAHGRSSTMIVNNLTVQHAATFILVLPGEIVKQITGNGVFNQFTRSEK